MMSLLAYNPTMSEPEDLDREIQRSIRLPERLWRKVRSEASLDGKSANEWIAEQLAQIVKAIEAGRKGGLYRINPHSASLQADCPAPDE
jgi:hypothetical protein